MAKIINVSDRTFPKTKRAKWVNRVIIVVLAVAVVAVASYVLLSVFKNEPEPELVTSASSYIDARKSIESKFVSINQKDMTITVINTSNDQQETYKYSAETIFAKGDSYEKAEPSNLKQDSILALIVNTEQNLVESVWSPVE